MKTILNTNNNKIKLMNSSKLNKMTIEELGGTFDWPELEELQTPPEGV